MNRQRKKAPGDTARPKTESPLFDLSSIASMTECTGVLPAQTEKAAEDGSAAALKGMFSMPRGTADDERK